MKNYIKSINRHAEQGVACLEYAILVALLALVSTLGIAETGLAVKQSFDTAVLEALGGGTATNGIEEK